jgi:hypothetical protein
MFSITCTVFEVFALFNIEYCDGEDLMQLYWGFWSVLQVGSNIAIFGVMLQLWIALGNVETPSWAVALGTPVLVLAAMGWIFREISKQACKRILRREVKEDDDDDDDGEKSVLEDWISRAYGVSHDQNTVTDMSRPTIVPDIETCVFSGPLRTVNIRRYSTV